RRRDHLDTRRRGHSEVGGDERDVRAAAARLLRERDTHPPRGAVPEEANGVERLAGTPGRNENALARERAPGIEQDLATRKDLLRFGHPPHADLAFRKLPLLRADQLGAPLQQERRVPLRGGVL